MKADKNILLVEDSEEDYLTIQRAFKMNRISNPLVRLKTGDDALDYLQFKGSYKNASHPLPNLVMLDLNLPGLDGHEVLKRLKSDANLAKLPVIILTTSDDEIDIARSYESGANSYMNKPVDFQGFVNALAKFSDYWFEIALLPEIDNEP